MTERLPRRQFVRHTATASVVGAVAAAGCAGEGSDAPDAEFSFDDFTDSSPPQIGIGHDGEVLTAENTDVLRIEQNGEVVEEWEPPIGEDADNSALIFEGDFESGDEIAVVWVSPDGDAEETLATWEVP